MLEITNTWPTFVCWPSRLIKLLRPQSPWFQCVQDRGDLSLL